MSHADGNEAGTVFRKCHISHLQQCDDLNETVETAYSSRLSKIHKNSDLSVPAQAETVSNACDPDLGSDLVGGNLTVAFPVPNVHCHVVLRAHRNDVLQVGRKRLKRKRFERNHVR